MLKQNSDYRHSTHSVLSLFYPQSLGFFELFLICLGHVCVTDHIVLLARATVSEEIFKVKFFVTHKSCLLSNASHFACKDIF